jgi:site-specific DNA-methyltransferase (adenine-specific)
MSRLIRNQIIVGDALRELQRLPSDSIDTIITSPPYHLLRRYSAGPEEIGTEATVGLYVERIVAVCDELARVLKSTGSLWLNLGDSYSRHHRYGAPAKSLLGAPERIMLGLIDRGWVVRNKLVWAKPNPMPASVADRLNTTWEPLYLLVRSRNYYFDLDAVREPHRSRRPAGRIGHGVKYDGRVPAWAGPLAGTNSGLLKARAEGRSGHPNGKNPGDVWTVPPAAFRGAHFATFPERLIEKPLLATCPERSCRRCGLPWVKGTPTCRCHAGWSPGLVLDPFMGAGTVAVMAQRHGRDWLGIELNPTYRQLALRRLESAREEVMSNKERSAA